MLTFNFDSNRKIVQNSIFSGQYCLVIMHIMNIKLSMDPDKYLKARLN